MLNARTSQTRRTFLLALLAAALIFLPFLIYDRGYFIYYGDFNVQQIPFYRLAHQAVRSGDIFWNWNTDLGVNFIGSYSFYLLFSPFFWLTLPFPTEWVPHMMAPLLVLKTACAALTAHLYLRRFVKDERFAVTGSMLYAFSGWMAFNIFFNHFHEVAVFFPLLLIGVEKLVTEDKRGFLAMAVLVNAAVNYWFFVGEAVFVIIYVCVRATDRSWGLNLRKFALIAVEAVIGVGCAAAAMLPSVMALMGNPRTGTGELLTGWDIWLYWHEQRQPAILQSLFFPPELPARPNFLPDHGAKWSSLSGWLPMFSMTGVLAYFFRRRDDWLKKLLAVCLVCAMIPALNSAFILLNDSYYARWFYMPVLFMALATVRALEELDSGGADFARGIKWTGIMIGVFAVMSGLTPRIGDDEELVFGLADKPEMMWIYTAIAIVCLIAAAVLTMWLRRSPRFGAFALAGVLAVSVGFQVFYIANGKVSRGRGQWIVDHAIYGSENILLPDADVFSRVDVYDGMDNIPMFWGLPTIQAFHSIVPPSIMEFYPSVGVKRDVGSRPETEFYALRPLLSVRWLFVEPDKDEPDLMPGYHFYDEQNDFNIYENDNFLPMGFSYDAYVTPTEMEDVAEAKRSNLMLRAVVLEEDAALRNADILSPMPDDGYYDFDEEAMAHDVSARRLHTADSFTAGQGSFSAITSFIEPRLVFFSVPWDKGWTATLIVDGVQSPLQIEKANLGFMAVRVPSGSCIIRFDYMTPGLVTGAKLSAVFLFTFTAYMIIAFRLRKKISAKADDQPTGTEPVTMTFEQYGEFIGGPVTRAQRVSQALENAARQPGWSAPPCNNPDDLGNTTNDNTGEPE